MDCLREAKMVAKTGGKTVVQTALQRVLMKAPDWVQHLGNCLELAVISSTREEHWSMNACC